MPRASRDPEKNVQRREVGFAAQAVPEVDRKAGVAGPQRVSRMSVTRCGLLRLDNAMHGERTRALQPERIPGSLVELQQRVAVAARAMTEVGPFGKRPGRPDRLAGRAEELVERRAREAREADDETRGTVTELEELLATFARAVELGTPVRLHAETIGGALHRRDDATLPRCPCVGIEKRAAADQRQGRGHESMHGVQIGRPAAVQVLRPVGARMALRPLELAGQLVGRQAEQIRPALRPGQP